MRQGGTRIRAQHTLGDKEDSGAQASNAMEGLGATFGETLEIDVDIAEIRNLRLRCTTGHVIWAGCQRSLPAGTSRRDQGGC